MMRCENVAALNALVSSGGIHELIRINEAQHENRYSQVADMICRREVKAVMIAGPSSSGKTTSAYRLATQLRVRDKMSVLLSLDDYYIDREKIPTAQDGSLDLEHINTIDTQLFSEHIAALIAGEMVELPHFNFITGSRERGGNKICLRGNSVIIAEGLHALNPALLPYCIGEDLVFKLYVTPMICLHLDDHGLISPGFLRLLRRIVRDHRTRGASVQKTMSMWDSVRRGEQKWIFPFRKNADAIFNSSANYELPVLKTHILPLLTQLSDECFEQICPIVKILDCVREADVDDEIPPTSLIREFIGGNTYYR